MRPFASSVECSPLPFGMRVTVGFASRAMHLVLNRFTLPEILTPTVTGPLFSHLS